MVKISPELDNKLKALGICPMDLSMALMLVRNLRITAIQDNIGPKAMRIAILFAELSDRHFMQQKLHPSEEAQLQKIAQHLFRTAKEIHKGRQ